MWVCLFYNSVSSCKDLYFSFFYFAKSISTSLLALHIVVWGNRCPCFYWRFSFVFALLCWDKFSHKNVFFIILKPEVSFLYFIWTQINIHVLQGAFLNNSYCLNTFIFYVPVIFIYINCVHMYTYTFMLITCENNLYYSEFVYFIYDLIHF